MDKKLMYTVTEVHKLFGLSRGFILALINNGTLKAIKVGTIWRIKASDLDEYFQSCENNFSE